MGANRKVYLRNSWARGDYTPAPPARILTLDEQRKVIALQYQRADRTTALVQVIEALAQPDLDVETALRFSGFLVNDGIVS